MTGKRDSGQGGVQALAALTDEILDPIAGADLDEMERRLKLATASVKLRQAPRGDGESGRKAGRRRERSRR